MIKELIPTYLTFLGDICRIETPSENKNAIDKMADIIEEFVKKRGFQVERIHFDAAGDFLRIQTGGDQSLEPVMLMAHMDTVHPIGAFGAHVIREEGEWLYGPGVMDCKGGIATALLAMEILKREQRCRRPITLLLTSDEEVSGQYSGEKGIEIIQSTAKSSCAVFNCEPGTPGEITISRKGILCLRVEVSGKATHAGNAYFSGANAICEAASQILQIEACSEVNGSTFNCGLIKGGTATNTVADNCEYHVDIRATSLRQMEEDMEKVVRIISRPNIEGTITKFSVVSKHPPMECTSENQGLLDKWNVAAEKLGLKPFVGVMRGGASDASYTVMAGAPTLCSCAMIGYGAHSLDERVLLSSLEERISLICQTIYLL